MVALVSVQATSADDAAETSGQQPNAKPLALGSCVLADSETQFMYELTHVDDARVRATGRCSLIGN